MMTGSVNQSNRPLALCYSPLIGRRDPRIMVRSASNGRCRRLGRRKTHTSSREWAGTGRTVSIHRVGLPSSPTRAIVSYQTS
jgi:hypothetical protein